MVSYYLISVFLNLLNKKELGYKINKKMKLEFGYKNQFFENRGRGEINILCFYNF